MKDNVVSIERSETTRESPTVFLVEKCSRFECLEDDGLGGVRALVWAVVIQALISIIAIVAWLRFR
jgi:hypothetical protein